jgi:glycerol kinase
MGSTRSRARWVSTSGVYFVTAFSGLLAPYWDPGATGLLVGLTSYTTQAYIVRATLEANAFQTRAVIDGIKLDSKSELAHLKVDGGMTNGDVAMEVLADNHFRAFSVSSPGLSPSLTQALHQGSAHTLSKPEPGRGEPKPRVSRRGGPCTSLFSSSFKVLAGDNKANLWITSCLALSVMSRTRS